MRLFVAVDLDDTLRRAAARVARSVREALEQSGTYGISWVAPDNFHLTLRFLGEVQDAVAGRLQERLRLPYAESAFALALADVGVFPPTGSARVIWLGVSEGAGQLQRLYAEVEQRIGELGLASEGRPYRAHLTIARFRVPAPARVRQAIDSAHHGAIGACTIRAVTLYRSRLSPKGAIYTPLVHAPLSGKGS